jgi:hypothetical protein
MLFLQKNLCYDNKDCMTNRQKQEEQDEKSIICGVGGNTIYKNRRTCGRGGITSQVF